MLRLCHPFRLLAVSLLTVLPGLPSQLPAQWVRSGFNGTLLDRGGNVASDAIELPFLTNIRGSLDDQSLFGNVVHVCTDGFVSFGPFSSFCPLVPTPPADIQGAFTALAPLYRDLRLAPFGAASAIGSIGWGVGTVGTRTAWGVTWDEVLTFVTGSDLTAPRNSFQMVLVDRSDRALGDFDVEFNYGLLGVGYDDVTEVFAGAYDIGGFFDPDGNPYDEYFYTVAPNPNSRITMCWVGGSVNNAACNSGSEPDPGPVVPEPATWSLLAAGLGGLLLGVRRRRI